VLQSVLQCVAECCSVLQSVYFLYKVAYAEMNCILQCDAECVAVCCRVLQSVYLLYKEAYAEIDIIGISKCIVCCSVLQSVLQCVAACGSVCCSVLQCVAEIDISKCILSSGTCRALDGMCRALIRISWALYIYIYIYKYIYIQSPGCSDESSTHCIKCSACAT